MGYILWSDTFHNHFWLEYLSNSKQPIDLLVVHQSLVFVEKLIHYILWITRRKPMKYIFFISEIKRVWDLNLISNHCNYIWIIISIFFMTNIFSCKCLFFRLMIKFTLNTDKVRGQGIEYICTQFWFNNSILCLSTND